MKTFLTLTITFILFLIGLPCFAQEPLVYKESSGIYNSSDLSSVIKPNQAFLLMTKEPSGGITSSTVFTLNDLLSHRYDINFSDFTVHADYGRLTPNKSNKQYVLAIIDDTYYYGEARYVIDHNVLPQLNSQLLTLGLGTVSARSSYITLLNGNISPSPIVLVGYLKPWVLVGFGLMLSLPLWWVIRRFLR